jgi:hypothetical protein
MYWYDDVLSPLKYIDRVLNNSFDCQCLAQNYDITSLSVGCEYSSMQP